jgi:hypothetical protein
MLGICGAGDAFGVGDAVAVEWPVCWAIAGAIAINNVPVTNHSRRIIDSTGLSTVKSAVCKMARRENHRAMSRRTKPGYDVFMSFMVFMSHESPPQQHSCLSEELTWFLIASFFFISHESPQQAQQQSLSEADT